MHSDWLAGLDDIGSKGQPALVLRINPEFASNISQRTEPYKNFPRTARPALEKVADYVRFTMIPRTFSAEGPGWRKLSKRTQKERASQGYGATHPILVRSRDLFNELTKKSHPRHVEIIKTGKYARIEIGGSSEKFTRNQAGNLEFHIPARPMIPGTGWLKLPATDRVNIKNILETSIRQELSKNVR